MAQQCLTMMLQLQENRCLNYNENQGRSGKGINEDSNYSSDSSKNNRIMMGQAMNLQKGSGYRNGYKNLFVYSEWL